MMMIRSVLIAMSFFLCAACKTGDSNEDSGAAELQSARGSSPKRKKGEIGGWGFEGFTFAKPAKPGVICTQEVKPEQLACLEAKGKPIAIEKCKYLCSVPIFDKSKSTGKVTGFSFEKLTTAEPRGNEICPMVLLPEEKACRDVKGQVIKAKGCKVLCSKLIADMGKIVGYNFDGVVFNQPELLRGTACAQVVRPEEEACHAVQGKSRMADGCKPICSEIINPEL